MHNGYRFFPGVKSGQGVTLTSHPVLVQWSSKSRAIPLLPLWAVRPVQSLSACTRVHFTVLCMDIYDYRSAILLYRNYNCNLNLKYRVSLSLEAPKYCLCIQSNSAGFSFVNTGKQVHLKHASRHFERNLVKDVHHRSDASRNWLKS